MSAPSDCNWKMTSFSDFPIFFAMSLTLIFAAAIYSPLGFPRFRGSEVAGYTTHLATTTPRNPLFNLGLFRILGLSRLVAGLAFFCFFFAGLILADLLVLARELEHLRGHVGVDAVDGGQIVGGGVEERVEIVVAGILERVAPLGRH